MVEDLQLPFPGPIEQIDFVRVSMDILLSLLKRPRSLSDLLQDQSHRYAVADHKRLFAAAKAAS